MLGTHRGTEGGRVRDLIGDGGTSTLRAKATGEVMNPETISSRRISLP
jgi:hypothetical protein